MFVLEIFYGKGGMLLDLNLFITIGSGCLIILGESFQLLVSVLLCNDVCDFKDLDKLTCLIHRATILIQLLPPLPYLCLP